MHSPLPVEHIAIQSWAKGIHYGDRTLTVLVTGAGGFLGRTLVAKLLADGHAVSGISRTDIQAPDGVRMFLGDLRSRDFVTNVLAQVQPRLVFHLAGLKIAPAGDSWRYYEQNVVASANLFDAAACRNPPVLVATSSATVYGRGGAGLIPESSPMQPLTAYGASKAAMELAARAAIEETRLPIICARLFNLLGPGQRNGVVGELAQRIMAAERAHQGSEPQDIQVGPLDARRDFIDVRDAARALLAIAERGRPGQPYNVASGVPHSIEECFDGLAAAARIKIRANQMQVGEGRDDDQVGDISSICRETDWAPGIPFAKSLVDTLESARNCASLTE